MIILIELFSSKFNKIMNKPFFFIGDIIKTKINYLKNETDWNYWVIENTHHSFR